MDLEAIKPIVTIGHIIGAVIGAGGAFYSDVLFFRSLKDKKVDRFELSTLRSISAFVWVGLGLLLISGVMLFLTNPAGYATSTKFVSKMIIVLAIAFNGALFHIVHIPFMVRRARMKAKLFQNAPGLEGTRLILSGVVSMVSWTFALVLGSLQSVPWSITEVLAGYVGAIALGAIFSSFVMQKLLSRHARSNLIKASIALVSSAAFLLFI